MRLVCLADTHLYEHELPPLPYGDALVHAGDLLRRGTLDELARAAAWLKEQPHRHKIVVAGNHDRCFQQTPAEARALLGDDVVYLRDEAATIDGVRFWGSPWQPEFGGWAFNLPRGAALVERWAQIPAGVDVLITHGPPRGFGDGTRSGRAGCEALLEALARVRPALHLFGHIHEGGGLWRHDEMVLANVTTWECERGPTVINYDPRARQVTPIDVPPARPSGAWS